MLLADRMGLRDPTDLERLAQGALLHDIGKIGIPDRILLKPGKLTEDEEQDMRRHPELGASLIGGVGFLRKARELVLAHHERFDGSGYPRGLAGQEIPIGARIFAVVDAFDALTTARPYRQPLPFSDVVDRIAMGSGTLFDPRVVEAFLGIHFRTWAAVASRHGAALHEGREAATPLVSEP